MASLEHLINVIIRLFFRAVYRKAELYLIDDIFASLDSETAAHIFNRWAKLLDELISIFNPIIWMIRRCLCALLGKKAVLLVTNDPRFMAVSDLVVRMQKVI